jgi:hypothetical protein
MQKDKVVTEVVCHEDISGSGGLHPPFLTSALDTGKQSVLHPGSTNTGEQPPAPIQ